MGRGSRLLRKNYDGVMRSECVLDCVAFGDLLVVSIRRYLGDRSAGLDHADLRNGLVAAPGRLHPALCGEVPFTGELNEHLCAALDCDVEDPVRPSRRVAPCIMSADADA